MNIPKKKTTRIELVGWPDAMDVTVRWSLTDDEGHILETVAEVDDGGNITLRGVEADIRGALWERMSQAAGDPDHHAVANAVANAIVETGVGHKLGEPLEDGEYLTGSRREGKLAVHKGTPRLVTRVMEAAWPDEDDRDVAYTIKTEWVQEKWTEEFQSRYLTKNEYERAVEDHVALIKECNTPRFKIQMEYLLKSFHASNDLSMSSLSPKVARLMTAQFQHLDGASGFRDQEAVIAATKGQPLPQLASDACMYLKDRARNAETFYITPKMMPVLKDRFHANFGGWQKGIEEHELISSTGIVFFGRDGFGLSHHEQQALGVRASQHIPDNVSGFMWLPCTWDPSRIMTIWFMDLATPQGIHARMLQLGTIFGKEGTDTGQADPPGYAASMTSAILAHSPRFYLDGNSFMQYGTTVSRTLESPFNALAMSVWSLLYEKKVAITGVPCAPIVAKRNKKHLPETGEVNVIYLRTEVAKNPELKELVSGGTHLRYRFKVRSHWQRYHTKEGVIWKKKSESTRGPKSNPDAPYIETDNVYALKR